MAVALPHPVQWVTASTLWGSASADPSRMQAPGLLQFESDRFMEELAERLQGEARPDLRDLVAKYESHRERFPGEPADPASTPLKLYQPAHGRFYLVAASLVCRLPGLPDHVVDPTRGEKAGFVMRRRGAGNTEEAWVVDPTDAKKQRRVWAPLSAAQSALLASGEELLPLFPVNFTVDGKRRRMAVGLVPTSSQATFEAAGSFQAADPQEALKSEAEQQVTGPYEQLKLWKPLPGGTPQADIDDQEAKQQEVSRYLLLDFASFLSTRLPAFWDALPGNTTPPGPTGDLYTLLQGPPVDSGTATTWRQALLFAWEHRGQLAAGETAGIAYNLRTSPLAPELLRAALMKAAVTGTYTLPSEPVPVGKLQDPGETHYVLRCVYLRPGCGPLCPPVVSAPTADFRLAPFFDPDAPGRPVRIVLPVDTSIRGLRKFKKNVGFALSSGLRKQMSRVGDLKKTMDGELDAGTSFNLGELCMFSIPIITLCAFMVLMIFLSLLNIIFWWMPFLKICLPKAKEG
ncbi:hypothetical protein D7V97_17670 [Corallococcus sp. CA053C]|uniref:hypothetical protein n=1 Tax=Corallococcus sp. CA053C TaxID=2316732 RepID=UPI000EA3F7BE|nr:hypothetical protein [Corallococcus sp. CA053C]RKH09089.1 hypothetical protein D7V97_17670 [Corallococcus sp. CA053C]